MVVVPVWLTLHTTDREMHYFYGARALNEVFYLEDFLGLEKEFPNFHFHLALDRPDPAADAAGVKYTPGFVHQVMLNTYLKDHEAPEDIEYYMCGPGPMSKAVVRSWPHVEGRGFYARLARRRSRKHYVR